ncbi:MAG: Stp1/IreP family PP2C-type Ser/Thr phosphatase [Atopobiaceae bacterium]|nr:Stp1/IreP family PP2C-type Ser/Thr phosphatase [Atopobiaceae bacterium]
MSSLPWHLISRRRHEHGEASQAPVNSPGHDDPQVTEGAGAQTLSGATSQLAWAARTDVGLVRGHNEDSFLALAPTFAVSDGMGGHAAGEVASAIAVSVIADNAPTHADDLLLGAAVESANTAVIEGAATGKGKPGMGCTASVVSIEQNKMAVAHVGDSRVYLLHNGALVRLTHDHSYVEELVDAGEITADEARVHPSRSVITRALGSDPDMYADHFTIDVSVGDRVILCSDGLSSMIEDSQIEAIAVSSATPQAAVDNLVAAALQEGGHDNVTVVVVDVADDGVIDLHRRHYLKRFALASALILGVLAALFVVATLFVRNSWYVGANGDTVAVYHGVNASLFGHDLYALSETSAVQLSDLPEATQTHLREGVTVSSEEEAHATIESYREQIESDKAYAQQVANKSTEGTETSQDNPAVPKSDEGGD